MVRYLSIAALAILAACSGQVTDQKTLALACQTAGCVCTESPEPLLGKANTTPVRWKRNGDAYCPKNFELRRTGS